MINGAWAVILAGIEASAKRPLTWIRRGQLLAIGRLILGGFAILLFTICLVVLLLVSAALRMSTDGEGILHGWFEGIFLFLQFLIIGFLLPVGFVYFIRALHAVKEIAQHLWRQEATPHILHSRLGNTVTDDELEANEEKFVEWIVITFILWFGFIALLLLLDHFLDLLTSDATFLEDPLIYTLGEVVAAIPIVGNFVPLFHLLPGQTTIGTLSYIVTAVPLAVSIRNLMSLFEHVVDVDRPIPRFLTVTWLVSLVIGSIFGLIAMLLLLVTIVDTLL